MQNNIIKYELLDNSVDQYITINPTKQQVFSIPTEESQMFSSKSYSNIGYIPTGYKNDPSTQTENRDTYITNIINENSSSSLSANIIINAYFGTSSVFKLSGISDLNGNVNLNGNAGFVNNNQALMLNGTRTSTTLNLTGHQSNAETIILDCTITDTIISGNVTFSGGANFTVTGILTPLIDKNNATFDRNFSASFMPTNYIGLSVYNIPTIIDENYSNIKLLNNGVLSPFYNSIGNLTNLMNGLQFVKIPATEFATILYDPVQIAANGGNVILWDYRKYHMIISPKYVETNILNIDFKKHYPFEKLSSNLTIGVEDLPTYKRRNIYYCSNNDFKNTVWNFEGQPNQSGRLLGSVVEIWNSDGTILKQQKIMNENDFGFSTGSIMNFVLSPDNMGYDPIYKDIIIGDLIRVYPIETAFNQIIIEIDFIDKYLTTKSAIQYMTNDVARDMSNAIYEIYDDNGLTINKSTGNIDGNVIQKYQIIQYGNTEIRQRIK